jgi:LDH2 family malate/lactate/ureidoglycolate dehydrogenase
MASAKIGNELKMRQSTKTEETTTDEELEAFVARAFIAAGLPDADAQTVAGLMVEADLRGSDTHGVIRLPLYVRRLRAGGINAKANIRVMNESTSVALIDGDNAMGHLVMHEAALLAIEKAKATGIGWVGARMSNHAGPAALYVTQPLDHDMIGLYFAVGSNNHLPPWGGSESLLGTNPMAVAVPALAEPPIVLDMAPTVAAYGKVRLKAQRGEAMPVGWMIDREGKPLTDPKRVQALLGRDLTVFGDGLQTRSFCYVDDLIDGLIRLMNTPQGVTGPINLGNPKEFTVLQLASLVIELTGSRSRIVHRPRPQDDRGSAVLTFPRPTTCCPGRRRLN